ncbi:hypothetical protein SEVIR_6G159634v4 [Setaria viridis]|uniref:probable glutathione S-transferase BZ2 n=1 Tax=Setaria viridis TaxID=4556 RepID=UPI003B3A3B02
MACVLWKFWLAIDTVSLGPTSETRVQVTADARAALRLLEGAFKDCSSGAGFFSGSDAVPGFLDLALGCFLSALRACGRLHGLSLIDWTGGATGSPRTPPLLDRWSHRFATHPAARRGLPDTNKVVEFTRFFQAKFKVDVSK